ncbi:MAG: hypothetical protein LBU98_01260, partial [Alistipes sp.]|nr:hypothetical protein [Alistipes sp.]
MKNYFKKYTVAGWLLCLLFLSSCAMDQRFVLPRGPEGPAGKSAYEVWMEWIENNGDPEWEGGTEMPDWLLYLKGDKGDPGDNGELPELADLIPTIEIINNTWWINGEDTGVPATGPQGPVGPVGPIGPGGAPGLSAYQLWLELIADGNVPDPHNPEEMWDPENDSEADFWYYLKGTKGDKGETAYQLWVIDVKSEAGLDDPHKDGDEKWPTTETDMDDFYRYLMGAKGLSAYELWKADVLKLGGLDDPHKDGDEKWPATEADTQMDDFYRYLTGLNGENGLSAYELWKDDVLKPGGLDDPHNDDPEVKWPTDDANTGLEDFYRYLRGQDGDNGTTASNRSK